MLLLLATQFKQMQSTEVEEYCLLAIDSLYAHLHNTKTVYNLDDTENQ